jgi:hypothetical protein
MGRPIRAQVGTIFAAAIFLAAGCGVQAPAPEAQPANWQTPAEDALPSGLVDTAAVTPAGGCTNAARFVDDLTFPDGTRVAPGALIDKRWSVQNTGTCDWGSGYRLVQVSGQGLSGPPEIALYPARSGTAAVWQVELQAPTAPGEYDSRWQARAPDGVLFGDVVFAVVVVDATVQAPAFVLATLAAP